MYTEKTLILGFYDRDNLGDESYKYSFVNIIDNENVQFVCMDDISHIDDDIDVVICGGGDIINDYFMKKAQTLLKHFAGRVYALSVGIPYSSCVKYLHLFDHVFVRSRNDYSLASREIGSQNVTYYPDAAFSLSFIPRGKSKQKIKRIGLCLAQPLFYGNKEKVQLVTGIIETFKKLQGNFEFHIISFNTHETSLSENDNNIGAEMFKLLNDNGLACKFHDNLKTPSDMLKFFNENLDFNVCMRFHSVVFSIMSQTPFVALYSSQKIDNLLQDFNCDINCCYKLENDNKFKPTGIDSDHLYACLTYVLNKKAKVFTYSVSQTDVSYVREVIYKNKKTANVLHSRKLVSFIDTMLSCKANLSKYLGIDLDSIELLLHRKGPFPLYNKSPLDFARFVCFLISNNLNDPCVWGLRDNLGLHNFCLVEAIDFIWKYTMSVKESIKTSEVYYPKINQVKRRLFFNVDSNFYNDFSQYHRSGWGQVVGGLMNLDAALFYKESNIILDTYVDRSFHWGLESLETIGVLPYKTDWIGVIHHTFDTTHSEYNCVELFKNTTFLTSLDCCKGLIVLSEYLAKSIRTALGTRSIQVYVLTHPMETVNNMFTMTKFLQNPQRRVVQIGAWLRNPYAIYELPTPSDGGVLQIKKAVLKGKEMDLYFPPSGFIESLNNLLIVPDNNRNIASICRSCNNINKFLTGCVEYVNKQYQSVEIIDRLDNDEYDELLSKNIVFLNLVDCSAVNTVSECIVRNTILLVNRHPALEEVLGLDYPGFYDDTTEAAAICQDENRLYRIYNYMTTLDKDRYRLEYFIQAVQDVFLNEQNIDFSLFKKPQKMINVFKTKYQTLSKYLPDRFYTL